MTMTVSSVIKVVNSVRTVSSVIKVVNSVRTSVEWELTTLADPLRFFRSQLLHALTGTVCFPSRSLSFSFYIALEDKWGNISSKH
jgi:hypothetical protein